MTFDEARAQPKKIVRLLGTRGLPARHGGFETCVEHLAPFLRDSGWKVVVYCQHESVARRRIVSSYSDGIELVNIYVRGSGVWSTVKFDVMSMLHALRRKGVLLSFGYPTAFLFLFPLIFRRKHVVNMDGIEWKRSQFGLLGCCANYVNEWIAALTSSVIVADHPEIARHLATRVSGEKIVTIPYGADATELVSAQVLDEFEIRPDEYAIIVARPVPDNGILELVSAFSECRRGKKLLVLGDFSSPNRYQQKVLAAASDEVVFVGAIYDRHRVHTLRKLARFYMHGHTVGGTNPSLLEALAAGAATLAHDNVFNRWVAGDSALYYKSPQMGAELIKRLFDDDTLILRLRQNAEIERRRFAWDEICQQYCKILGN